MTFEKLPAVEGFTACLTCGAGASANLEMDWDISVGFGNAGYSRDGVALYEECRSGGEHPTVADVEALAAQDPDHDWRIFFDAPLYLSEYQRQGDGLWVLVKKGRGFA